MAATEVRPGSRPLPDRFAHGATDGRATVTATSFVAQPGTLMRTKRRVGPSAAWREQLPAAGFDAHLAINLAETLDAATHRLYVSV
jgi:hypothetical protein